MNNIDLSERMRLIADQCFGTVADIGTDHGFIPIWLVQNEKCERVILSDINEGPLMSARENIRLYGLEDQMTDLRLGSGLRVLKPFESDSVIIAGMGGELIFEILAEDIGKSKSYKRLILQPRTKISALRKWLDENGFMITADLLVREKDRICSVICASAEEYAEQNVCERFECAADYVYPPFIISSEDALCREYLQKEIHRLGCLAEELKTAENNQTASEKLAETTSLISFLSSKRPNLK